MLTIQLTFAPIRIITALLVFFLGISILKYKRPIFIPARYFFVFMCLTLLPHLLVPVLVHFFFQITSSRGLDLPPLFAPADVLLLVLPLAALVFFWLRRQGYNVLGVSIDSLRSGLRATFERHTIPFEERLSAFRLTSLDTDVHVSAQFGTGKITVNNRKQEEMLEHIVQELNNYYAENNVEADNRTAIFYMIFGVLLLIVTVIAFYLGG